MSSVLSRRIFFVFTSHFSPFGIAPEGRFFLPIFPLRRVLRGISRKPPEWAKTKEKQMSREKLSTGCELSTASLKKREGEKRQKREGEKRHSPLNPIEKRGREKNNPGFLTKPAVLSPRARTRGSGASRARARTTRPARRRTRS